MSNCVEVWAPEIVQNKLTRYSNICQTVPTHNYWTPLTEQVEDSESTEELNNIIHKNNQAVFDTAATSNAGKPGDNAIHTNNGKIGQSIQPSKWGPNGSHICA